MSRNSCSRWSCWALRSVSEEDVVQVRDSGHRVAQGAGSAPVIPQDLPALHPRQRVLDPSTNLAMTCVEFFLPFRKITAITRLAERHDHGRIALVAAIGHHRPISQRFLDPAVT